MASPTANDTVDPAAAAIPTATASHCGSCHANADETPSPTKAHEAQQQQHDTAVRRPRNRQHQRRRAEEWSAANRMTNSSQGGIYSPLYFYNHYCLPPPMSRTWYLPPYFFFHPATVMATAPPTATAHHGRSTFAPCSGPGPFCCDFTPTNAATTTVKLGEPPAVVEPSRSTLNALAPSFEPGRLSSPPESKKKKGLPPLPLSGASEVDFTPRRPRNPNAEENVKSYAQAVMSAPTTPPSTPASKATFTPCRPRNSSAEENVKSYAQAVMSAPTTPPLTPASIATSSIPAEYENSGAETLSPSTALSAPTAPTSTSSSSKATSLSHAASENNGAVASSPPSTPTTAPSTPSSIDSSSLPAASNTNGAGPSSAPTKQRTLSYAQVVMLAPITRPSTPSSIVQQRKEEGREAEFHRQWFLGESRSAPAEMKSAPAPQTKKSIPVPETKLRQESNKVSETQLTRPMNGEVESAFCEEEYINGVEVEWEKVNYPTAPHCQCSGMADVQQVIKERRWNLKGFHGHKVYERKVKLEDGTMTRQTLTVSTSPSDGDAFQRTLGDVKRLDGEASYICIVDTRGKRRCSKCRMYKSVNGYSINQWKKIYDWPIKCKDCSKSLKS